MWLSAAPTPPREGKNRGSVNSKQPVPTLGFLSLSLSLLFVIIPLLTPFSLVARCFVHHMIVGNCQLVLPPRCHKFGLK